MGRTGRSLLCWSVLLALCLGLATVADSRFYHWSTDFGIRTEQRLRVWYGLFHPLGWISTWVVIAAAYVFIDHRRLAERPLFDRTRRALLIVTACASAGACSVVVKLLVRRERPRDHAGEFWFRPWSEDTFSASGLAMPSGDAAIAFAGVLILRRLHPSAWPVWLFLGLGCALHRTLLGAHFASDVVAGGAVGALAALLAWKHLGSRDLRSGSSSADKRLAAWTVATSAVFAGAVIFASLSSDWRPAKADDVPGLYSSRQRADPKLYYLFEPGGTYRGAALFEEAPPRFEPLAGRWSFSDGSLRIGAAAPVSVETSGKLLRWTGERGRVILRREERWEETDLVRAPEPRALD